MLYIDYEGTLRDLVRYEHLPLLSFQISSSSGLKLNELSHGGISPVQLKHETES